MIKIWVLSLRPAKLFQNLMRPSMLLVLDHTELTDKIQNYVLVS